MKLFFILLFGLIIGSFLNVCIYRIPNKQSIFFPSSHCTHCLNKLSVLDLFPIISYVLLKGNCRYCNEKISIQYPIIEIINTLLYFILFCKFGINAEFFCCAFFSSLLVIVFTIDLNNKIIPNGIILTGFIVILILRILELIYYLSYEPLFESLFGLTMGAFPIFIIILLSNGGMGAGDMKLMGIIGMWFGAWVTYIILLISIVSAAIISLILILTKNKTMKSSIAFAPFLTVSAFICLILL